MPGITQWKQVHHPGGVMPSVLCRVSGTENLVSRCTQGQATFLFQYTDFLLVRMIDRVYNAHVFSLFQDLEFLERNMN